MNRLFCMGLLSCLTGALFAQDAAYPTYQAWLASKHLRVGVKKAVDYVELESNATLLVLDDDKVVGTFKPGGAFFVGTSGVDAGGVVSYLRVRSHRSEEDIERHRDYLRRKFSNVGFKISRANNKFYQLTLGPFKTQAECDRVQALLAQDIYKDSFVYTESSDRSFFWVNRLFEKEPLAASKPGIVCQDPNQTIDFEGTPYRGALYFRVQEDGRIKVINKLPLETYLQGVVPSELSPWTYPHLEAHKAQAIAARTYALRNLNRYRKKGYDICDTPACQAYEGAENENALSTQAVTETAGLVIYHENKLINAMYTSTDGTGTDDVEKVFPKMTSPYLRGKSGYLAEFPSWDLPARPVDRKTFSAVPEDLAVRALIWGFPSIPNFSGNLTGEDLKAAFGYLTWVVKLSEVNKTGALSYKEFWQILADQAVFKTVVTNQVKEQDLAVLLRHYQIPDALKGFAALLVRYDMVNHDQLLTFGDAASMPRARAYEVLIKICERLGPEPDWARYRMDGFEGQTIKVTRNNKPALLDVTDYTHYVAEIGDVWEFVTAPHIEEWDRVYTLQPPFTAKLLRVKESGLVGSLDRFSAHDAWLEHLSLEQLEKTAKQTVKGLKGLRDVRIVERSPSTGRVTKLALIASSGEHLVDGLNIRWSLGVRDNLFDILPGYRNQKLTHLTVMGRGMGHGVGMSQVGAFALARMGWDFKKILTHYYTGVDVREYDPAKTLPND